MFCSGLPPRPQAQGRSFLSCFMSLGERCGGLCCLVFRFSASVIAGPAGDMLLNPNVAVGTHAHAPLQAALSSCGVAMDSQGRILKTRGTGLGYKPEILEEGAAFMGVDFRGLP